MPKKVWNAALGQYVDFVPEKKEKNFISKTSLVKYKGHYIGKTTTKPYRKNRCSICDKILEHPKEIKKGKCLSCQIDEVEKEIEYARRNEK